MMHFDLALIYLETAILNETISISVYNIYIYIYHYVYFSPCNNRRG